MKIQFVGLAMWLIVLAPPFARAMGGPYYLALGDSLAQGVQPSAAGDVETNQGYVDDLYAVLFSKYPNLTLAKLGCPGETTSTMINGGVCSYAQGSQLAAAVNFLQTNKVGLITLDIGANDVDHCVSLGGIDWNCLTTALTTVRSNLFQIAAELRLAAGPNTLIVAMSYYDPFLAAWSLGSGGQFLAEESLLATNFFNDLLANEYKSFEIRVADVAHTFHIEDFTQVPNLNLPVNVFLTLSWTWMGAPPPLGPDIHANSAGYAAIADAFVSAITTDQLAD